MSVLRFLAERQFNRFDVLWIAIMTSMFGQGRWVAALCVAFGLAFISVCMEGIAARSTRVIDDGEKERG